MINNIVHFGKEKETFANRKARSSIDSSVDVNDFNLNVFFFLSSID